jgi:hypothetical protein
MSTLQAKTPASTPVAPSEEGRSGGQEGGEKGRRVKQGKGESGMSIEGEVARRIAYRPARCHLCAFERSVLGEETRRGRKG